jgi:hypothetical protein
MNSALFFLLLGASTVAASIGGVHQFAGLRSGYQRTGGRPMPLVPALLISIGPVLLHAAMIVLLLTRGRR